MEKRVICRYTKNKRNHQGGKYDEEENGQPFVPFRADVCTFRAAGNIDERSAHLCSADSELQN